ncbi:primosomal protein N', partial [Burkholderia sp. SG-MS1]|uniref:primosomal protein N' family DNA-binding protein n=1 Tax=Paraburkholderia sp. SG-MS1 TaxID=2023741 RepID=UPI001445F0F4|nr:primosomal protein N' [Paraburkholderia sp. SG-MS1]
MSEVFVRVALDHPLPTLFDYRYDASEPVAPGMLISVPFGKRHVVGLVCEVTAHSDVPENRLRSVSSLCTACPPLSAEWLRLSAFAADYYQRGMGEVALPALPQALRDASRWSRLFAPEERYSVTPEGREALPDALPARASALRKLAQSLADADFLLAADARALHPKALANLEAWQAQGWVALDIIEAAEVQAVPASPDAPAPVLPTLTDEQTAAVEAIRDADGFAPFLLHGVTGSGKTEVYLRALAEILAAKPDAQALVLVPEINLTPQFEAAFRARFAALNGTSIVTLHSGLAEGER